MAIYQRGQIWWARITHNGERIYQSSGTTDKQAAQEWHDKLKAELWNQAKLGTKPEYLWEDAVTAWYTERLNKPTAYIWKLQLRWIHPHLSGVKLKDINREVLERIKTAKQKEGVKPRTVNSITNLIRSILLYAVEREWIDRAPAVKSKTEPSRRVRYLSAAEEARLLEELPKHLKQIARFGLVTGLRMSNIVGLQWSQIDIVRSMAWVHPDQAKEGKAISVPLNDDACLILREQMGQHLTHVFSYLGKPVLRANQRAWREAVKRAGIEDFTFHCLRHTWASRLIQSGVPLHALMEMGGWSDVDMVRKYAHFGSEHLLTYANKISTKVQNWDSQNLDKEKALREQG